MLKLLCDCDQLNDERGYQRESECKVNVVQPNSLRPWHKALNGFILSIKLFSLQ